MTFDCLSQDFQSGRLLASPADTLAPQSMRSSVGKPQALASCSCRCRPPPENRLCKAESRRPLCKFEVLAYRYEPAITTPAAPGVIGTGLKSAWRSMSSTACWSWDARATSASLTPKRDWGRCVYISDPCTTLGRAGRMARAAAHRSWTDN
jgi:hypothetical protein